MADNAPTTTSVETANQEVVDRKSMSFVGRWERLVSRTNWEKGRIIQQWRETLIAAGAPATEYSDEAWSQRVKAVSGQHVGRLRRVALRFGGVFPKYKGLYWSHFQAVVDWDDAEMWLEGAVQNTWSISQMRQQRHEALGGSPEESPADHDVIHAHFDEDHDETEDETIPPRLSTSYEEAQGPRPEGPDFGTTDEIQPESSSKAENEVEAETTRSAAQVTSSAPTVRPFDQLPELPENVADAFEAFKLAILHHRADKWEKISPENLVASLEALKTLVLTPDGHQLPA